MKFRNVLGLFSMESITFVMCLVIFVAGSMKAEPTDPLGAMAKPGRIQENQMEEGDYTKPTETGTCGIKGTSMEDMISETQQKEPKHCWCTEGFTVENVQKRCMKLCNDDSKCNGYNFSEQYLDCQFYTASEICPTECDREYREPWGEDTGVLVNIPDLEEGTFSGCYIKN